MIEEESGKRDLITTSNIIFELTKEVFENATASNKRLFNWAVHETWILKLFPRCLTSKKAYEEFYKNTGRDIRNFDWFSNVKTNENRRLTVHKQFMHEHLTTTNDFKKELLYLYKEGKLDANKIIDLISQQRVCWITREEDSILRKKYKDHREDPLKAYEECGIEIFDANNENLTNIMKPTWNKDKFKQEDKTEQNKIKEGKMNMENLTEDIVSREEYYKKLKKYFQNTPIEGKYYSLDPKKNQSHAWFEERYKGMQVSIRIHNNMHLNDINIYFHDKTKFYKLYAFKDYIENKLGYELYWDEKSIARAGRFGPYSSDENADAVKRFNFDLDIEKIADELVHFYKVVMQEVILQNF